MPTVRGGIPVPVRIHAGRSRAPRSAQVPFGPEWAARRSSPPRAAVPSRWRRFRPPVRRIRADALPLLGRRSQRPHQAVEIGRLHRRRWTVREGWHCSRVRHGDRRRSGEWEALRGEDSNCGDRDRFRQQRRQGRRDRPTDTALHGTVAGVLRAHSALALPMRRRLTLPARRAGTQPLSQRTNQQC
jgi:hypothetical protein